jgi:hypothetical protein
MEITSKKIKLSSKFNFKKVRPKTWLKAEQSTRKETSSSGEKQGELPMISQLEKLFRENFSQLLFSH